jgi:hypothetical protein
MGRVYKRLEGWRELRHDVQALDSSEQCFVALTAMSSNLNVHMLEKDICVSKGQVCRRCAISLPTGEGEGEGEGEGAVV